MLKLIRSAALRQFAVVIIANLTTINVGLNTVWASPMLVKLRDENQTILSRPVRESEEPWLVAIAGPAGIMALLITGTLINWLGRKTVILVAFIPRLIMCFLSIFSTEVWLLLLGRAVSGVADVFTLTALSTYASEVAGKKIRGACGTATQIMSAVGMMIMFAVGPFVSYIAVNVMITCIAAVTFIPLMFIPESPYFLHVKGRTKEAEEVLTLLRGSAESAREDIKEYDLFEETKIDNLWSLIKDKTVIKTTAIVYFLGVGYQMSGYNAVNLNLQTIFETTQTSVSSEISSLIIGLLQFIACLCTFTLTDKFGRKPILMISLIGMCLGMAGLATFFEIFEKGRAITGFLNYLPLISIVFIIFGFNAGMGSLFWMLVAELYDSQLRPYGVSSSMLVSFTYGFILLVYFPPLITAIGAANTYWLFGISCFVNCLVIFFFVPETKGRSFAEIQNALGRKDLIIDDRKS